MPELLYPIFAILIFPVAWCAVTLLLGTLTGWRHISQIYPFSGQLPTKHRWRNCSIPNLTMRNCADVGLDEKGMYFQGWVLFRIGFPTLFVPWSEIKVENAKFLFIPTLKMTFRKTPSRSFQFYKMTGAKFAAAAGKSCLPKSQMKVVR